MLPGELRAPHGPDIEPGEGLIPGRGADFIALPEGDLEEKVNIIVHLPGGGGRLVEEGRHMRFRVGKAPVDQEDLLADVPRGLPRVLAEFQVASPGGSSRGRWP